MIALPENAPEVEIWVHEELKLVHLPEDELGIGRKATDGERKRLEGKGWVAVRYIPAEAR